MEMRNVFHIKWKKKLKLLGTHDTSNANDTPPQRQPNVLAAAWTARDVQMDNIVVQRTQNRPVFELDHFPEWL